MSTTLAAKDTREAFNSYIPIMIILHAKDVVCVLWRIEFRRVVQGSRVLTTIFLGEHL